MNKNKDKINKTIKEEFDPRSYDPKKVAKGVTNNVLYSIPGISTFYGIYKGIHDGKRDEVLKKQKKRFSSNKRKKKN